MRQWEAGQVSEKAKHKNRQFSKGAVTDWPHGSCECKAQVALQRRGLRVDGCRPEGLAAQECCLYPLLPGRNTDQSAPGHRLTWSLHQTVVPKVGTAPHNHSNYAE